MKDLALENTVFFAKLAMEKHLSEIQKENGQNLFMSWKNITECSIFAKNNSLKEGDHLSFIGPRDKNISKVFALHLLFLT